MSEYTTDKPHPSGASLADTLSSMAGEITTSHGARTSGERIALKSQRLVSVIAERLSVVARFGRLREADLYTISQLSNYLLVTLRTLRFYEQAGLLHPGRDGSRRLYTRHDLDRLKVIVVLREMEVSLSEIKGLMTELDTNAEVGESEIFARIAAMLSGLRVANDNRIAELRNLNDRIGTACGHLSSIQ